MAKSPIQQLQDGDLPRMVRWYDPRLLAKVFVRTIVSSVFGQYADHRLIQAATDDADRKKLLSRYDYSDPFAADPAQCVECDYESSFWIDYISDIGDGFDATYTTAYLLAQDKLDVGLPNGLWSGSLLIMGGDQCYPQATREDYQKRLQVPYSWALNTTEAQRKVFAIPGNHDWYDGLSAFDSLFCSSRDKLSESRGNLIGGWKCTQHRSYWALKLPNKWWIWGADIQFSKYLDINQVNYFEMIASQMGPDDKLIICMAEPAWMLADFQGQDEEQNFFKITAIARRRGAKVCAVIAGDWHHYARYHTPELGVHFITAGGGGSFLHPTHVLKTELEVRWPEINPAASEGNDATTKRITEGFEVHKYGAQMKKPASPGVVGEIVGDVMDAARQQQAPAPDPQGRVAETPVPPGRRTATCYPSRTRSWFLGLRNLAFPLYNFPFAVGIGVIYWLVTWQFHTVDRQYGLSSGKIDQVGLDVPISELILAMPLHVLQATFSMSFAFMFLVLWLSLVWYVQADGRSAFLNWTKKILIGTAHFIAHSFVMFTLLLIVLAFNNNFAAYLSPHAVAQSPSAATDDGVRDAVREALEPWSQRRREWRERYERGDYQRFPGREWDGDQRVERPALPSPPPGPASAETEPAARDTIRELVGLLHPLQMSLLGALAGGFIWGAYWVLAGIFGHMHAEDAFAALRIRDYRSFLRMKFEKDRLIIYPIGVDRIPRKKGWHAPNATSGRNKPVSLLVPREPIKIHLVEEPIIIKPSDIKS